MTYAAIPQLGVPVHHRDIESTLETIDGFIEQGRATGRSHQIVTVNTDFLVQARKYGDVHAILRSADLALPDGMPIVWASAALGQGLPGRITGADLVPALAKRASDCGYRLMFFGGSEGVADRAAESLRREHPDLLIASTTAMVSATCETPPEVLDEIRGFRPDVICVALGHPKQERWIRRHAGALGIPVAIGVGGTFDFIAGERRRAAPIIQQSGFEWLFRLLQEPRRLTARYLTDILVFLPSIMMQVGRTRLRSRRVGRAESRLRHPSNLPYELEVVESTDTTLVVALPAPGRLDHHAAATLASLAVNVRRQGRELRLVAPGRDATRSMEALRLDRLVPMIPARPRPVGARSHSPRTVLVE